MGTPSMTSNNIGIKLNEINISRNIDNLIANTNGAKIVDKTFRDTFNRDSFRHIYTVTIIAVLIISTKLADKI